MLSIGPVSASASGASRSALEGADGAGAGTWAGAARSGADAGAGACTRDGLPAASAKLAAEVNDAGATEDGRRASARLLIERCSALKVSPTADLKPEMRCIAPGSADRECARERASPFARVASASTSALTSAAPVPV